MSNHSGSSALTGLVESIEQHKKFGGLLKYSINCVVALITPPNPDATVNVRELVSSGGLEALVSAAQEHPGNAEVLEIATSILTKCAGEEDLLSTICESGACQNLLSLVSRVPELGGSKDQLIDIIHNMANKEENIVKLVDNGAIPTFVDMLNTDIQSSAPIESISRDVNILAKLVKVDGAIEQFIGSNGVNITLELLGRSKESQSLTFGVLSILRIAAQDESMVDLIKQNDGIVTIVHAMEEHYTREDLLVEGGKLLSSLCSSNDIDEAMNILENPSSNNAQRMYAAAIISNLSLDEQLIQNIIQRNGIETLLGLIDDTGDNVGNIAVRALGRLAATEEGLEQLLKHNGVTAILGALNNRRSSSEMLVSAVLTFKALAQSEGGVEAMIESGGLVSILDSVRNSPQDTNAMECMLSCLNSMIDQPAIFEIMNNEQNIQMMLDAVNAHPDSQDITKSVASILSKLAEDDDRVNDICSSEGITVMLKCLEHNLDDLETVVKCFSVISKLVYNSTKLSPEACILVSKAVKRHASDTTVFDLGKYIVNFNLDDSMLELAQKRLKKCTRDLKFIDTDESDGVKSTADTFALIESFGLNEPVVENVNSDSFVKSMVSFVRTGKDLSIETPNTARDKLLLLAIEATTRICSASAVFAEKIALANIAGMLSIYKGDLAPTENARAVAMLFASIIENTKHSKSATSTLTSGGCLATMLAISDVNRDSEELNAACISALLSTCQDLETAQQFVRSVGSKALVQSGILSIAISNLAKGDAHSLNSIHFLQAAAKIPTLMSAAIELGVLDSLRNVVSSGGSSGWASVVDESTGKTYYYNKDTQETSWENPISDGTGIASRNLLPAAELINTFGAGLKPKQAVELGGAEMIILSTKTLLRGYTGAAEERDVLLSSLDTLSEMAKIDPSSVMLNGGVEILDDAIRLFYDDEDVLTACAKVFANLTKSPGGNAEIIGSAGLSHLVAYLASSPQSASLGKYMIASLDHLCKDKSSIESVSGLDVVPAVQSFLSTCQDNGKLTAAGDRILTATASRARGATISFDDSVAFISDGFENRNGKDVLNALEALSQKVVSEDGMDSKLVATGAVRNVLSVCLGDSTSPEAVTQGVSLLGLVHKNAEVVNLLQMNNNIPKLLATARKHHDNANVVKGIMKLLTKLAVNDVLKLAIISEGGVNFLIETIEKYMENIAILASCVSTLANLSYNNLEVAEIIVANDTVPAIEAVMQRHIDSMSLLSRCLVTLSNLMFKNDEHTIIICQACGDEIVHMIRMHGDQPEVLASGLRALGTLVYCEKNIPIIVGEGATKAIIDSMRKNQEDEDNLLMAVHCLSNLSAEVFAVAEAPDSCGKDFHPRRHGESTTQVMVDEGAIDILLETMRDFDYNSALGIACMEVIPNICDSPEYADMAIQQGVTSTVLHLLQQHDWDNEIVCAGFTCLSSVCELALETGTSGIITDYITEENIKMITTILENIDSDEHEEAFRSLVELLQLFLAGNADNAKIIANNGVIKALLKLIQNNTSVKSYICDGCPLLTTIAHVEGFAQFIAKEGMYLFCECLKLHIEDTAVLKFVFDLLGALAFENENLPIIVQFNGQKLIVDAVCSHPHDTKMILSAIHTLENIAMGDAEYCRIALDAGAKECAEALLEAYEDDEDVIQACKSTLLTFSAMSAGKFNAELDPETLERRRNVRSRTLTNKYRSNSALNTETFLDQHRRALVSGAVMVKHHKSNAPRKRLVYVTKDFSEIRWKEDGGKKDKGSLKLREVTKIIVGATTKPLCRKHIIRANPKPACCFTIKARSRDLDLELPTEKDRDRWNQMLISLLQFRADKRLE